MWQRNYSLGLGSRVPLAEIACGSTPPAVFSTGGQSDATPVLRFWTSIYDLEISHPMLTVAQSQSCHEVLRNPLAGFTSARAMAEPCLDSRYPRVERSDIQVGRALSGKADRFDGFGFCGMAGEVLTREVLV